MRILFTGGSGKAGRHVVAHLVEQGHRILNCYFGTLRLELNVDSPARIAQPSTDQHPRRLRSTSPVVRRPSCGGHSRSLCAAEARVRYAIAQSK